MYGPPRDCKGKAKGRSTDLRKCIRPLGGERRLLATMSCAGRIVDLFGKGGRARPYRSRPGLGEGGYRLMACYRQYRHWNHLPLWTLKLNCCRTIVFISATPPYCPCAFYSDRAIEMSLLHKRRKELAIDNFWTKTNDRRMSSGQHRGGRLASYQPANQ